MELDYEPRKKSLRERRRQVRRLCRNRFRTCVVRRAAGSVSCDRIEHSVVGNTYKQIFCCHLLLLLGLLRVFLWLMLLLLPLSTPLPRQSLAEQQRWRWSPAMMIESTLKHSLFVRRGQGTFHRKKADWTSRVECVDNSEPFQDTLESRKSRSRRTCFSTL